MLWLSWASPTLEITSLGCSSTRAAPDLTPVLYSQPRGSTLPLLEGPQTDGVTIGDKGECVITPSTDVNFDPGLKGKNKLNYLRNYWLLIGKRWFLIPSGRSAAPWWAKTGLCIVLSSGPRWSFRPGTLFICKEKIQGSCVTKSVLKIHLMFQNPSTDLT